MQNKIKQEWFSNIRGDMLSGLVVALSLIPGAIGFSIIAGVDPMIGFYASFSMANIMAFVGKGENDEKDIDNFFSSNRYRDF